MSQAEIDDKRVSDALAEENDPETGYWCIINRARRAQLIAQLRQERKAS